LPAQARYCAACGRALPSRRAAAPIWVVVMFWAGTAVLLWAGLVYGVVALGLVPARDVASGYDPQTLRQVAAVVAIGALCVCAFQVASAIGLVAGHPWARPLATLVCLAWFLTLVGIPLGLAAIVSLWRSRRPSFTGH
jgi:hypothetical protein